MATVDSHRAFLPAAGRDWLLPLYDPFTRLLGFDRYRNALVEQAGLQPRYRVLDVGCGTGTLAILIARTSPHVEVIGVDPDPKALARARRKARARAVFPRFELGLADSLGYPDASFDRLFSSMMLHHLEPDQKAPAMLEFRRVLKPGGRLELLDFAPREDGNGGVLARLLHADRRLRDNASDRLLALMAGAGFRDAKKLRTETTLVGPVAFYQASA